MNILGVNVTNIYSDMFISDISESIEKKNKIKISYANAHTLNKVVSNPVIKNLIEKFDIIHPDGVGVYYASKFLYGKQGLKVKLVGSDFYYSLIQKGIEKNWKFYFFGHDLDTLNKIKINYPELNISGVNEGYSYQTDKVISSINYAKPDILIVGLSFPSQEKWIFDNFKQIDSNVILAVGDGIKIFAGTKFRGPGIMRKIGFEWLMRLFHEPGRLWKRYLLGNPIFIFNIIKFKFKLYCGK